MKVILFSSGLRPEYGGPAISEGMLAALLGKKLSINVYCRKKFCDVPYVRSLGLDVTPYQPISIPLLLANKQSSLAKHLAEADLVHLNGHWRWEYASIAKFCGARGIPYLIHPRGMMWVGHRSLGLKRLFNRMLGNEIVRHAARVIALSHYETQRFTPYPIAAGAVRVIPNAIVRNRTETFPNLVSEAKHGFLYLGRLEKRKNLKLLLDGFTRYRAAGGTQDLLLVGPDERGYQHELEVEARKLGLAGHVRFSSGIYGEAKWAVLHSAMALVYPALEEPFGRVPFEAIGVGTYPIIPDASGAAEYLKPFLPHSIYKQDSAAALAETLHEIERSVREGKMADLADAQLWVRENLNWERITETVLGMYQEILTEKSKGTVAAPVDGNLRAGGLRK